MGACGRPLKSSRSTSAFGNIAVATAAVFRIVVFDTFILLAEESYSYYWVPATPGCSLVFL